MPTPKKNESEKDFVSRCIPYVLDEGTASSPDQAVAICHSLYKESKKKKFGLASVLKMGTASSGNYGHAVLLGEIRESYAPIVILEKQDSKPKHLSENIQKQWKEYLHG